MHWNPTWIMLFFVSFVTSLLWYKSYDCIWRIFLSEAFQFKYKVIDDFIWGFVSRIRHVVYFTHHVDCLYRDLYCLDPGMALGTVIPQSHPDSKTIEHDEADGQWKILFVKIWAHDQSSCILSPEVSIFTKLFSYLY